MELERCAGCGVMAKKEEGGHPWVGVMNSKDAKGLGYNTKGVTSEKGFVHVPICSTCHAHPEKRVFSLKCHFFKREHAFASTARAGEQSFTT